MKTIKQKQFQNYTRDVKHKNNLGHLLGQLMEDETLYLHVMSSSLKFSVEITKN